MQNVYAIEYLAYCEGSIYLLNDYVNDYLYVFKRKRSEGLSVQRETPRESELKADHESG